MSNAHVFRKAWLERLFPEVVVWRHQRQAHILGRQGESQWEAPDVDLKVRDVCSRCNSGWMDDLDHAAEDTFATDAVLGRDVRLGTMAEKATLARWCCLIAVLLDRLSARPVIPPDVHLAVFRGEVPDGAEIWLTRIAPLAVDEPHGFSSAKDLELDPEGGQAFFVTFGVGQLAVQVFIPTDETPTALNLNRAVDPALIRRLWPDPLMALVWPPPASLPGTDRVRFCNSFQRLHPFPGKGAWTTAE